MNVEYYDVSLEDVRQEHSALVEQIETQGLLYPVTVVNDVPVYDGAVSYPAIMRSVQTCLETVEA